MLISNPPFWRPLEPFSDAEFELLRRLFVAHTAAARNSSASTGAVINAYSGSKSYPAAIASALLAFGEVHGPVIAARQLLENADPVAQAGFIFGHGKRVAGWGSGLDQSDSWNDVFEQIETMNPALGQHIADVTKFFSDAGKAILPNPACATAAAAIILGVPEAVTMFLLVTCRLPAWSEIIAIEGGA